MFQLFRCYSELLCCFSCSAVIRNCCAVSAVPLLFGTAVLFLLFRCYIELLCCFCCSAVIRNCCSVSAVPLLFGTAVLSALLALLAVAFMYLAQLPQQV